MRPLTTVLVGDGSAMVCAGRLRLGRTVEAVEEAEGYERPLVSEVTRVATSMDGGGFKGGGGSGCCRSCTSDIAFRNGTLASPAKDVMGKGVRH